MLGHVGFFLFVSGQAVVGVTFIGWVMNLKSQGAYGAKTHMQTKHHTHFKKKDILKKLKAHGMISVSHGPLLLQARFSCVRTPEAPERLCVAVLKCT